MSEIITQGRRLADLGVAVIESVEAAGGNDDDARRIFKDEHLRRQIGQLVMHQLELAKLASFHTVYDQSIGLMELIKRALGPDNVGNINFEITPERFSLKGTDIRMVQARVEPFFNGETREQAAKRLVAAGYILANTGDLAGFFAIHPKEVEKWGWVVALNEDSRWTDPDGGVRVPCARVYGADRYFGLAYFRHEFGPGDGALVLCDGAKKSSEKAAKKFIVADMFQEGNAVVKISWIDDDFKSHFYGMTIAQDATIPRYHHDPAKDSLDAEILADLGGEAAAEVSLAGVYELLALQPRGDLGALLANGYANIFYVRDKDGVLRTVRVHWDVAGWVVLRARSVGDPNGWGAGRRVFSR